MDKNLKKAYLALDELYSIHGMHLERPTSATRESQLKMDRLIKYALDNMDKYFDSLT